MNEANQKSDGDELSQLQSKVQFLEDQLERMEQLTAIGELASTTTHEFNNILTMIINYAQMGMRHKDEETRNKSFEKILGAAQKASKITATVLGLARNRKPGFEPTDLTSLTEDVLLLLEREMTKYRIAVERKFKPVPEILANANQIQQILVNLLINARQAMQNGGRLVIRIGMTETNDAVELVVRDYGTGISADKLPHIFDAFYTTKSGPDASGKGGSGLGLSLCKNIMEVHHGKIRVESTPGKGTAFTLRFPLPASAE
ncbi:MAG: ATP-binding protein [Planctomycetia bacterium]|nr:ATP-binding protein [Planctomycetia bacterium]